MEKQKWIVRVVSAVLVLLMLGTLIVPMANLVYADTGDEIKAELERLEQQLDDLNAQIQANQNDAAKAEQMSEFYQKKEATVRAQIDALKQDIAQRRADLEQKQAELALQVQKVEQAQDLLSERLRAMYEMQRTNPLSVLMGLEEVSDVLRFSENLRTITLSNDEVINNLKEQRAAMEAQAAEIQTDLDGLNAQEQQLEASQQELAAAIVAANNMVDEAKAQEEALNAALADTQAQYKAEEAKWAQWVAASSADQNYIADNGEFYWPIPGYYRISSDYGVTRVIYGVTDVHRGLDIPAPAGTPIYATAAGVVSTTAHWSYGTCVKISHSSSHVTVYGHMSSRAAGITDGVVVEKGQLIGYVGSTGNSTGNHLHFELDVNGSPTSVRPYLDPNIESQLYW